MEWQLGPDHGEAPGEGVGGEQQEERPEDCEGDLLLGEDPDEGGEDQDLEERQGQPAPLDQGVGAQQRVGHPEPGGEGGRVGVVRLEPGGQRRGVIVVGVDEAPVVLEAGGAEGGHQPSAVEPGHREGSGRVAGPGRQVHRPRARRPLEEGDRAGGRCGGDAGPAPAQIHQHPRGPRRRHPEPGGQRRRAIVAHQAPGGAPAVDGGDDQAPHHRQAPGGADLEHRPRHHRGPGVEAHRRRPEGHHLPGAYRRRAPPGGERRHRQVEEVLDVRPVPVEDRGGGPGEAPIGEGGGALGRVPVGHPHVVVAVDAHQVGRGAAQHEDRPPGPERQEDEGPAPPPPPGTRRAVGPVHRPRIAASAAARKAPTSPEPKVAACPHGSILWPPVRAWRRRTRHQGGQRRWASQGGGVRRAWGWRSSRW